MSALFPPLRPRDGNALRVLIVARISTLHQDPRSLDEQVALCKDYVIRAFSGQILWEVISSQSSGEVLDREELRRAEALVEAGRLDLVIVEDLARLCRRNRVSNRPLSRTSVNIAAKAAKKSRAWNLLTFCKPNRG